MAGKLYLCATPIGNLSDITLRVLETLRSVDLIAAEDTRNTIKLLNHFDIKTKMTSYHEHNKYDKAKELVDEMLSGKNIALVTDAGTPAISDPGEELVKAAYEAGLEVTSLPGACALPVALSLSGLSSRRFVFEGFLPADKKERAKVLSFLENEIRTIVIYEAPHHILKTLYISLLETPLSSAAFFMASFSERPSLIYISTCSSMLIFSKALRFCSFKASSSAPSITTTISPRGSFSSKYFIASSMVKARTLS